MFCRILLLGVLSFLTVPSAWTGTANLPADIVLPFDMGVDVLCFENMDPELAEVGIPVLGKLGARKGVCQGIAGIAAAFHENTVFDPALARPSNGRAVRKLLSDVVRLHKGGCQKKRIIPGYANLRELCSDYRREFLRKSIFYNANIAINEITRVLPDYLEKRDRTLRSVDDRIQLLDTISSIHADLSSGRAPLLMSYGHVVMVYGIGYDVGPSGITAVVFDAYDSNRSQPARFTYSFDPDGLPSMSNSMIWNVTPDRLNWRCY
jgi:hypothetical protein